ncbi:MAG: hypothetical protein ACYC3S_10340 [Chloroflexota bacterium]
MVDLREDWQGEDVDGEWEAVSAPARTPRPSRLSSWVMAGTFLLSAAVLLLEVALTRVFSFLLGYHYVFALVGLAMLGLGIGAAIVSSRGWATQGPVGTAYLLLLSMAACTAVIASTVLLRPLALAGLPLAYIALGSLPFLPAGGALALVFADHSSHGGRLYFADLGGGAFGSIAAVVALSLWGGPGAALFAGVLFALGGLAFALGATRDLRRPASLGAVAVALFFIQQLASGALALPALAVGAEKTMAFALSDNQAESAVDWSSWDAFARTDVVSFGVLPGEKEVFIDGGAGSPMRRFDGNLEEVADLRGTAGYYPFAARDPGRVLIIGPGGGLDVLLALLAKAEGVTAVELNPGTVEAVRRFADFNGGIYDLPNVRVAVDEGRSYLRRSDQRYDTIFLSLVMAQAAERAGLALAENYVYTVEAIQDYLAHLSPEGKLALRMHDAFDLGRVYATAVAALEREGKSPSQATQQIVLYYDPRPTAEHNHDSDIASPMMIVFAAPLSPAEAQGVAADLKERGLAPLLVPHVTAAKPFAMVADGTLSLDDFVQQWPADVSPTYDDKPFFFQFDRGISPALVTIGIFLVIVGAAGWYLLTPRQLSSGLAWYHFAAYFGALGAGFALVEMAAIQRLTLFLGHPTFAVASSLAVLLLTAGLGGLLSQRVPNRRLPQAMVLSTLAVGALVLLWAFVVPSVTSTQLAQPQPLRVAITAIMLTPLGLVLGIPFPTGLRLVGKGAPETLPAFWAINGFAAVAGSVLGMIVASVGGFTATLALGAAAYSFATIASGLLPAVPKPSPGSPPSSIDNIAG